ncbi:MAG TPA: hypothetical protein VLF69_06455 [Candidatus Saccharimonadales bacterium]|nr:hypothetical protein [Candidatus Saccharimonadales bacterium]
MKNLEQLLQQHTPKPTRPLKHTFTQTVVAEITARPEAASAYTRLSRLRSRLLSRAGLLSLGTGALLIGGTAMAVTLWPTPSVSQTTSQELASGNHIVGYDAKNCGYFASLDGTKSLSGDDKVYYEIRQGSKLTDQQLQTALQGVCEENISNNAISALIKQLPQNLPGLFSTQALHVDAISSTGITLSLDPHYSSADSTLKPGLTYTHFAPHLLVYNQSETAQYTDIHTGDTVKLVMQSTAPPVPLPKAHGLASPQYIVPSRQEQEDDNPENHPETIVIDGIVKIPALTANPNVFYHGIGSDFVRLEPCTTSPTGFCRAYDFVDSQQ